MTEAELAWSAGIVDGEGCISISVTKPYGESISPRYKLWLTVSMTHKDTIDRLAEIFGVTHQYKYDPSGIGKKDCYRIVVCGRKVAEIIKLIRPYMVTKAYYADLALEYDSIPSTKDCIHGVSPETIALKEALRVRMGVGKPKSGRPRIHKAEWLHDPIYQV